MITTPWGEELHLDELNQFLPINVVLQRHKYAQRLFHLNLSTQELSVLQAIVATAPGTLELALIKRKQRWCFCHVFVLFQTEHYSK